MIDSRALREQALALDADYVGVADLAPAWRFVEKQGGKVVAQFPRAISVGLVMPLAIVDRLYLQEDRAVLLAYRGHCYDVLNARLDQIASRLASSLRHMGYRAFPVRASGRPLTNLEGLQGAFSHKLAAHLAGLGWIGKSCLLVTPEVGPRVRWASILTDAPLPAGQPLAERCGDCAACVAICPVQAFTGRNFVAEESREARFDAHRCNNYLRQRKEEMGIRVCGLCVYECPHGKKSKVEEV